MTLPQWIADARKLCARHGIAKERDDGSIYIDGHPAQQALSLALDMIEVMQKALEECRVHNVGFQAVPFEIGNTASKAIAECEKLAGEKV